MPPKILRLTPAVPEELLGHDGIHRAYIDASCCAAVLKLSRRYTNFKMGMGNTEVSVSGSPADEEHPLAAIPLGAIDATNLARILNIHPSFADYICQFEQYVATNALEIAAQNAPKAEQLIRALIWFRTKVEERVDAYDFVHDLVVPTLRTAVAANERPAISIAEVYAVVCAATLDHNPEVHKNLESPRPTAADITKNIELRALTLCQAIQALQTEERCHTGIRHVLILTLNKIFPEVDLIEDLASFYNSMIKEYFAKILTELAATHLHDFIHLFCESLSQEDEPLKRALMVEQAEPVERIVQCALTEHGIDYRKPLSPVLADYVSVDGLVNLSLPFGVVSPICDYIAQIVEHVTHGGVDQRIVATANRVTAAIAAKLPAVINFYSSLERPLTELVSFLSKITGFHRRICSFAREEPALAAMDFGGMRELTERTISIAETLARNLESCLGSDRVQHQLSALFDSTTELRHSSSEDIEQCTEKLNTLLRNAEYDFIVNLFARFCATAEESDFMTMREIYAKLSEQPSAIFRVDDGILEHLSTIIQADNFSIETSPYTFNRLITHALFTPPPEWSASFALILSAVLDFLRTRDSSQNSDQISMLQKQFAKSYRLLVPELERLMEHYLATKNGRPFTYDFENFIIITPAMLAMINHNNVNRVLGLLRDQLPTKKLLMVFAEFIVPKTDVLCGVNTDSLQYIIATVVTLDPESQARFFDVIGPDGLLTMLSHTSQKFLKQNLLSSFFSIVGSERLRVIIKNSTQLDLTTQTHLLIGFKFDVLFRAGIREYLTTVIDPERFLAIIQNSKCPDFNLQSELFSILCATLTNELKQYLLAVTTWDSPVTKNSTEPELGPQAYLITAMLTLVNPNNVNICISELGQHLSAKELLTLFVEFIIPKIDILDRFPLYSLYEIITLVTTLDPELQPYFLDYLGTISLSNIIFHMLHHIIPYPKFSCDEYSPLRQHSMALLHCLFNIIGHNRLAAITRTQNDIQGQIHLLIFFAITQDKTHRIYVLNALGINRLQNIITYTNDRYELELPNVVYTFIGVERLQIIIQNNPISSGLETKILAACHYTPLSTQLIRTMKPEHVQAIIEDSSTTLDLKSQTLLLMDFYNFLEDGMLKYLHLINPDRLLALTRHSDELEPELQASMLAIFYDVITTDHMLTYFPYLRFMDENSASVRRLLAILQSSIKLDFRSQARILTIYYNIIPWLVGYPQFRTILNECDWQSIIFALDDIGAPPQLRTLVLSCIEPERLLFILLLGSGSDRLKNQLLTFMDSVQQKNVVAIFRLKLNLPAQLCLSKLDRFSQVRFLDPICRLNGNILKLEQLLEDTTTLLDSCRRLLQLDTPLTTIVCGLKSIISQLEVQEIVAGSFILIELLYAIPCNYRTSFISTFSPKYLQAIITYHHSHLIAILETLPEDNRLSFLTSFNPNFLATILRGDFDFRNALLCALPQADRMLCLALDKLPQSVRSNCIRFFQPKPGDVESILRLESPQTAITPYR